MALLLENYHKFHVFVAQRVSSDAVADDLLQQSLQKALEHPVMAQEATSILAWFYRILRSTRVDYYRARAAEEKKGAQWIDAIITEGRTPMPAVDEPQAAPCACLARLLPTLKPSYAELIQRIDLGEEPVTTVARALGLTEQNLYVRLHRARQAWCPATTVEYEPSAGQG
jgi:RNA polymerase sigma-70 factor (ECF subfamily)